MDDLFNRALAALPHGPEFRFIERLTALDPGKSGTAEYTLRGDESFLRGHFPGQPILPGVLLVEGAAQLAGVIAQCDPGVPPLRELKLTAIRSAKILGMVQPRETIEFKARIVARMGNLVQAQAIAKVAGRVVLEAEVVLSGDG